MIGNLTTPMLGLVATAAIGRLGDATLLGGVAMASIVFDCLFWLFGFLRMSTVAFAAQAHGAGQSIELRAVLLRGFAVAALIGASADRAADSARQRAVRRDGRQRGRQPRRRDLFQHPDLVGALGAGELRGARLAGRPGPRHAGARRADRDQPRQHGGDRGAGAAARFRHRRRRIRRGDRRGRGAGARRRGVAAAGARRGTKCRARCCWIAPNCCGCWRSTATS